MKNYINHIAIGLCILLGITGCIKEDLPANNKTEIDKNSILLSLKSSKASDSKKLLHNEDKLEYVCVLFFDPSNNKLAHYEKNIKVSDTNEAMIPLDTKMNGQMYNVYVIANYDVTTKDTSDPDIDKAICNLIVDQTELNELKELVLTTIFNREDDGEEPSFVMDGIVENVAITLGEAIIQPIQLERVAARILLNASFKEFKETIDGIEHIYTPYISGETYPEVTMYNGIGRTSFDEKYIPKPEDIVNPRVRTLKKQKTFNDDNTKTYHYHDVPLYSYANNWENIENQNLGTYLELKVVWHHRSFNGIDEQIPFYYQVPITPKEKLERNNAYEIRLDVGMKGSEVPTEAITLEGEIQVIKWNDITFDAVMNRYKYLSVDPIVDTLRNVATTQFKYASSSPIQVKIKSVSYIDYSTSANTEKNLSEDEITASGFKAYLVGSEIYFEHKIDKANQFYPYTIELEVTNDDDVEPQIIDIVQYPAIYIIGENNPSNSNRIVYNISTADTEIKGILSNGKEISFGKNINIDKGDYKGDKNPNLYTVYVSAFDENDVWDAIHYKSSDNGNKHDYKPYMIGDPREDTSNDDVVSQLKYYRATKSDAVSQSIVAPIFKVASSRGGLNGSIIWSQAKHRCSVYQENGYPAGRWRLPTEAEIQYIKSLSSKGMIPELFDDETGYIAASGRGWLWKTNNYGWGNMIDFNEYTMGFARCVYDVWYWGDEKIQEKDKFKWGDNPDGSLRDF